MRENISLFLTIVLGGISIYLYIKDKPNWASIIAVILTIMSLIFTIRPSMLMQKTSGNNTEEEYYRGTITKTGWESKFIGLRYTNPAGMNMSTEEELDKMNEFEDGSPSIVFNQNELGKAKLTTVFEMMSMSDDKSIIAGVCTERLTDEIDIFQFIESFESQIDRHPFYNYVLISDDKTIRIGNDDYIMVSYMVDFNNVFRYKDNYFRIVGDRVIMISLDYNDESARDNTLDAFTAY
ncbi:hypothetical protein [Roseburia sp. 1XD42-69]|uniref:hypothetical protein n=1 Tax=Roseburia sp. 1XD42-69 TaxID=2320088 RepID=UPI000EA0380A|nr:hypothetical protein [Roseburia sp. 1XD42-69]RKJ68883.1 hypothetical protein D7Y06_01120 [Roseburia sp. 1XD42-69]